MSRYFGNLASTALLAPLGAHGPYIPPTALAAAGIGTIALPEPGRHLHRDREAGFGIGYGNSSGYGTDRRYVADWWPQRFRCM